MGDVFTHRIWPDKVINNMNIHDLIEILIEVRRLEDIRPDDEQGTREEIELYRPQKEALDARIDAAIKQGEQ